MRKWIVPAIVVGLIAAAAYLGTGRRIHPDPLPEQKPAPRQDPEKIEKDIERAVREYAPKSLTKINDLSVSIEPMLTAIPAVEKVIVTGSKSPTSRIIQSPTATSSTRTCTRSTWSTLTGESCPSPNSTNCTGTSCWRWNASRSSRRVQKKIFDTLAILFKVSKSAL
jgi:hypothetical protein